MNAETRTYINLDYMGFLQNDELKVISIDIHYRKQDACQE